MVLGKVFVYKNITDIQEFTVSNTFTHPSLYLRIFKE